MLSSKFNVEEEQQLGVVVVEVKFDSSFTEIVVVVVGLKILNPEIPAVMAQREKI